MYYIELNDSMKVVGYCMSQHELRHPFVQVGKEVIDNVNNCPRNSICYYINKKIEYVTIEGYQEVKNEHEDLTKETHLNVEITTFDNLINMDLLVLMDEKINAIIKHLGLV